MIQELTPPAAADPLAQAAWGSLLTTSILEQFDHGILLLGSDSRVLHANRVALRECAMHGALRIEHGRLVALRQGDAERMRRALADTVRGLRTLLNFDSDEHCLPLVVLPLPLGTAAPAQLASGVLLVLMAKRSGTEPLNIELFAQANRLTLAERAVLKGLSRGLDPGELATANGVALSTVRTQITHIRQKTRTPSLRALLSVVNNLPPVVCSTELRA